MHLINFRAMRLRMRTKRRREHRSMFEQINGWMRGDWCDQQIALSCHMLLLLMLLFFFAFCIFADYSLAIIRLLCEPKSKTIIADGQERYIDPIFICNDLMLIELNRHVIYFAKTKVFRKEKFGKKYAFKFCCQFDVAILLQIIF